MNSSQLQQQNNRNQLTKRSKELEDAMREADYKRLKEAGFLEALQIMDAKGEAIVDSSGAPVSEDNITTGSAPLDHLLRDGIYGLKRGLIGEHRRGLLSDEVTFKVTSDSSGGASVKISNVPKSGDELRRSYRTAINMLSLKGMRVMTAKISSTIGGEDIGDKAFLEKVEMFLQECVRAGKEVKLDSATEARVLKCERSLLGSFLRGKEDIFKQIESVNNSARANMNTKWNQNIDSQLKANLTGDQQIVNKAGFPKDSNAANYGTEVNKLCKEYTDGKLQGKDKDEKVKAVTADLTDIEQKSERLKNITNDINAKIKAFMEELGRRHDPDAIKKASANLKGLVDEAHNLEKDLNLRYKANGDAWTKQRFDSNDPDLTKTLAAKLTELSTKPNPNQAETDSLKYLKEADKKREDMKDKMKTLKTTVDETNNLYQGLEKQLAGPQQQNQATNQPAP